MWAEYDVWLVDLDGTVLDVQPGYMHDVFEEISERLGHTFSPTDAERLWRGFDGGPDRKLRSMGIDPDRFWRTFHEIDDPEARAEAAFVYPDAEVLAEIPAPVGVVTHCQPYLTGPILDRLDIADWFDVVVCCTDDTGWKPDPAPVEYALNQLGWSPERDNGVLIGDSPADVGAAWNTGLDAVHVERFKQDVRGCCVRADRRISGLQELFTGEPTATGKVASE